MSRANALLAGVLILALTIAGIHLGRSLFTPKPQLPIFEMLGGEFSLPSTLKRDVSLSEFRGKLVLLNFGYTSCPDVCPTVLARMRAVLEQSTLKPEQLQLIFVTIDPERDTLVELATYLHYFHSSFIGLRGVGEQLEQVASLFKLYFEKQSQTVQDGYDFAHSDRIYLLDQQGQVRATYANNVTPDKMISDINSLL